MPAVLATMATVNPGNLTESSPDPHSVLELVIYGSIAALLSGLTAVGNLLVLLSFCVEKKLRTLSNYFLLSLAVADMTIGLISVPFYSLTLLMQKWPLPHYVCDLWLSIDYTMSNASVANLLVISIDRYLSVTRPLTYRANRTRRRVGLMIAGAWLISGLLWTPWIYAWPYIEGARTVPSTECYIQFLSSNVVITVATAVAAFYIPVTVMTLLYARIYYETQRRRQFLVKLQADRPSRHSCTCSTSRAAKRGLLCWCCRNCCTASGTERRVPSPAMEAEIRRGNRSVDGSRLVGRVGGGGGGGRGRLTLRGLYRSVNQRKRAKWGSSNMRHLMGTSNDKQSRGGAIEGSCLERNISKCRGDNSRYRTYVIKL